VPGGLRQGRQALLPVRRADPELGGPRDLRKEFPTPLDVLDEMHDIRWCGYPDGTSHMTPFLASQVRICEAFGIEVPRECLSASEGRKADSGRGRESSKLLGRGTRPAQNRIQAHPASA
jgi:hypothetical protein